MGTIQSCLQYSLYTLNSLHSDVKHAKPGKAPGRSEMMISDRDEYHAL